MNAEEAEKARKWKEEQDRIEEDWKRKIREAQEEIDGNIAKDEEKERLRQERLEKERKQYEDELEELRRQIKVATGELQALHLEINQQREEA